MTTIRQIFRPTTRLAAPQPPCWPGSSPHPPPSPAWPRRPGPETRSTPAAPVTVHTVTVGGTPGWQIAVFMVAAAVLAATVAVLVDRMRTVRRRELAPSAN